MDTISAGLQYLETIARMGWQSRNAALAIAPVLIILVAIFGVVKFYFGQESEGKINLNKYVFYNLFMLMLLIYYPYVIDITGSFTRILTDTFQRTSTDDMFEKVSTAKKELYLYEIAGNKQSFNQKFENIKNDTTASFWGKLGRRAELAWNHDNNKYNQDLNLVDYLASMLEVSFIRLVRCILEVTRNIMLSFLIIVGPFALMFEFIPFMRGIAQHWFKIYLATCLWLLTLNILDLMYIGYAEGLAGYAKDTYETAVNNKDIFEQMYRFEGGEAGILNLVIAICYIFVPFLTTLYAGGQAAQQIFGAMMSFAQMAVLKTAGAVMGGAKGISMGGGTSSVIGKVSDQT